MYKTDLTDLKNQIYIQSALLALDSLDEIFGMNERFSADQIFLELIKKSLSEFEQDNPLILEMKVSKDQLRTSYGMPGFGEFKSNFKLYLDDKISEDQIILVPNAIPQWRLGGSCGVSSYPTAGAYTYFSEYRKPYVFIDDIPSEDQLIVKGICSRPVVPDFLPDKSFNPDSEKAAIYWLDLDSGIDGAYFGDLLLANTLDYIRQLKASVQLPGLSVDIFGNIDGAYQELRSRCDQYKMQSGWGGDLLFN